MAAVRGLRCVDEVIEGWAERLGFDAYLDERLANLSKGTAQKVGLAQALLAKPGLLVLDEPWEGLDAQTRQEIPAIVAEVAEDGGIVLISDHQGEMATLADIQAWLLVDGHLKPAAATVRASSAVSGSTPLWASPTMQAQIVTSPKAFNGAQAVKADQARKPDSQTTQPELQASRSPDSPDGERQWVVEVAVSATDPDTAMASLRSAGHEVLAVREEASP
jgi:ABC-type multidrug transport system ATPase subunit